MEKTSTELKDDYLKHCEDSASSPTIEGFADWILKTHCIASNDVVTTCIERAWSSILKVGFVSKQKGVGQLAVISMLFGVDVFINLNARLKCSVSS